MNIVKLIILRIFLFPLILLIIFPPVLGIILGVEEVFDGATQEAIKGIIFCVYFVACLLIAKDLTRIMVDYDIGLIRGLKLYFEEVRIMLSLMPMIGPIFEKKSENL